MVGFGAGRQDENYHQIVVHPFNLSFAYTANTARTFLITAAGGAIGTGEIEVTRPASGYQGWAGLTALVVPA